MTGRLLAGRYRLGDVIGRGGMATIYRAEDTRLERTVAIKLLRPQISADPDLADRFRREALAATVLRHRNIVGCLDTGADPAGPFMVMELIEGDDLAARLRREGPLLPGDVARIGLDVARGLGAAHTRGIVHRDVKPSNILLARDGRAMITDFGIARLAADAEAAMPGTTLGSVQYFSPEQAQGATTTPASDVYGLGLVLYEALTGLRPWHGETSAKLALARVGAVAPSARDVRANVPVALDAIVRRALAPASQDRYASGNAMAMALEPLVASPDPAGSSRSPAGASTQRRATSVATRRPVARAGGIPSRRRVGRIRSILALGVVTLVVGGFAMIVLGADAGGATAEVSPRPTRTPRATVTPTAEAVKATATPRAVVATSDICRPILDVACSLGAGRYAPGGLSPTVDFTLGDGWSTALAVDDLVVLARDEGLLTLASRVTPPDGSADGFGAGDAKAIVKAFAATDGLKSTKPATVTIDGHKGRSVDVKPTGSIRRAVFRAGGRTLYVEPKRTTRLVALDSEDGPIILVIEPADDHTLRQILDTADVVASTIAFR